MRNPEYQFFDTDTNALVAELVAMYEKMVGVSVRPGSPEKLFIVWVAAALVQERVKGNHAANQNIPSRAEEENLDALADLFSGIARPAAQSAVCTVRFRISEPQMTSVLIPAGTRVTDASNTLTWATTSDVYVTIGETHIDTSVRCLTAGAVGNGYTVGQINTLVDLYDYANGCENITDSENGADAATDEEYYELLRSSMDGLSSGGARGSYIYNAKKVSTEIADVLANSPGAGEVAIYVLMDDGTAAGEEMKAAVLAACNQDDRRPMTDHVSVADPEMVNYDISFTYYIRKDTTASSVEIEAAVKAAVHEYVAWQHGKLGRDINPDELRDRIRDAGDIKRVVLTSPTFVALRDGKTDGQIPQVASLGTITITNGGFEDE